MVESGATRAPLRMTSAAPLAAALRSAPSRRHGGSIARPTKRPASCRLRCPSSTVQGMLERMPRRSSVRDSQLRESLSPPRKSRLMAVWAVLAVDPCVPRRAALRRNRAAKGSVSPVPRWICV